MKRRIAILTAAFMLLSCLSSLAQGFTDMPAKDSKYYGAFEYAVSKKIVSGIDGKLMPESSLTKAEALTFISRAKPFTANPVDISSVTDVSKDAWYYQTFAQAVGAKVISPDANNKLNPGENLTRRAAWDLLYKTFNPQGSYTPVSEGDKIATRGDFILWLYDFVKPQTTETPSEAPSEVATEYSDLKAQQAQEDMRVALGIRTDGSSYVDVTAYKDTTQTGWATAQISSGSSSRPSGGSNRPSQDDDEDDERETQPPTEPDDDNNTEPETQPPTDAPTEPEEDEPTYDDYDGPIDNDKDNVIDDPFDDGWRPPGWVEDGDDNGEGGGSGGGFDEEDDDFNINDDYEPGYTPDDGDNDEETTAPTDEETDAPTDEETDVPTDDETDAPSDDESDLPTDEETDVPSDEESDLPTDEETDVPSDDESDLPTDDETDVPSDEESDLPTDDETDVPSDEESDLPTDEETDVPSNEESDEPTDDETDVNTELPPATEPEEDAGDVNDTEDNGNDDDSTDSESGLLAVIFSKDWWFS